MPEENEYHNIYFAAVLCPENVEREVKKWKAWMKEQFGCVVAMKSPAHITLIPPFWFDSRKESELVSALSGFSSNEPEATISLNGFAHFGKRVLFVAVEENKTLERVKKQTENYFHKRFGSAIKIDTRDFHPHVTIANRDLSPADFVKAWHHFEHKPYEVSFTTATISLLKLDGTWGMIAQQVWSQDSSRVK